MEEVCVYVTNPTTGCLEIGIDQVGERVLFFFVYFAVTKIFVKISMGYFILVLFAVFASVVSVFIGENIHQIVS